jgi:hypothetical protein
MLNVTDWKTTALGIAIGALNLIAAGTNWKTALITAAITTLGAVARDPKRVAA